MQRVEGTGSEILREDANGNQCETGIFAGAKYINQPDRSEYTKLEIKKKDLGDFSKAISWACVDEDNFFPVTKFKEAGGGVVIVDVPGRFTPVITHEEISEICEDYDLLSGHFLSYMDVFNKNSLKCFLIPALNYLIQKSFGQNCELEPWVARVIELWAQK